MEEGSGAGSTRRDVVTRESRKEVPADNVLGVHISAGVAYFVLVVAPGKTAFAATTKVSLPENTDHWDALARFAERVVTESRVNAVGTVVFAEPRKYNNWSYGDARLRVELTTSAALALRDANIAVECLSQKTASVTLAVPFDKTFLHILKEKYVDDEEAVLHWKERAPALLVAMCIAQKRWP